MKSKIKNLLTFPSAYRKKIANQSLGFTLIELLIVVAIISILSTLLMVNFIAVRQRARDAQRKSDIRQIQSALELYRADNDDYPLSNNQKSVGNCDNFTSIGSESCDSGSIYMQKVPTDPNGPGYYNQGNFFYSSDGSTYALAACIENTSDQDSNICTSDDPSSCTQEITDAGNCTSGFYYVLQNP